MEGAEALHSFTRAYGTPFVTKLEIAYGHHVSLHGHHVSLHGHHVSLHGHHVSLQAYMVTV